MDRYQFGNRLMELRMEAGLSQRQLGAMVGVTDKAVSKWETGASKPGLDILTQLSDIFFVSLGELLEEQDIPKKKISKIVITGGPCAGKTTAMSWIQNAFTEKGYTVLFVPETATELISGGVAPWTCRTNLDYQRCQMQMQLEKEKVFQMAAERMTGDRVLIVCDRGLLDNKVYMNNLEFRTLMRDMGLTETEIRDQYDAIFHLSTAAKGAESFYTLHNNSARTETPEEARELDDRLIEAWTGHPHLRIIDNSADFEGKMLKLLREISQFLGEPEPYEIERKFLIEYPDLEMLESLPNCRRVDIMQTYLRSGSDEEIRVRQRGSEGSYIYYKTIKRNISGVKRLVIEERLSKEKYLELLMQADPAYRPIRKTRYCLTYDNQSFEIDIYPFWDHQATAEIEIADENEEVRLPDFLKVIREVTDDDAYANRSLARIG